MSVYKYIISIESRTKSTSNLHIKWLDVILSKLLNDCHTVAKLNPKHLSFNSNIIILKEAFDSFHSLNIAIFKVFNAYSSFPNGLSTEAQRARAREKREVKDGIPMETDQDTTKHKSAFVKFKTNVLSHLVKWAQMNVLHTHTANETLINLKRAKRT